MTDLKVFGNVYNNVKGIKATDTSDAIVTFEETRWQRPAELPDYSKLDISNEEAVYFTYDAKSLNSFASFHFNKAYTVDVGTLTNGVYTVLETDTMAANAKYFKLLGGYGADYVVLRATPSGTEQTITVGQESLVTVDGIKYGGGQQPLVEVYGRLPKLSSLWRAFQYVFTLVSITLKDMNAVTSCERFAGYNPILENVDVSGMPTDGTISLYYAFTNDWSLRYCYLHGAGVGNMQSTWGGCYLLSETDIESLNANTTVVSGTFSSCYSLKSLDLSGWTVNSTNPSNAFSYVKTDKINITGWNISGNLTSIFQQCNIRKIPTANYGTITNMTSMFYYSNLKGTLDLRQFDFGTITALTGVSYMQYITNIIIPDNFTSIASGAMRDNSRMYEIHLLSTTPPALATTGSVTTNNTSLSKIYVPYSEDHSVLEAYQNATNWSTLTQYLVEEDPT